MLRVPRLVPSVLLAGGLVLNAGCTTVLGIDGHYVLGDGLVEKPTVTADTPDAEVAVVPTATADATVVTPPPIDAGKELSCEEGSYQGTFKGSSPLFNAPLSGAIAFKLVQSTTNSNEFDIQPQGTFDGGFVGISGSVGSFVGGYNASVTGVLDCRARKMTGQLVNGEATSVLISSKFTGTLNGDYTPSSAGFTGGTWQEQGSSGNGTWTATRRGP